MRPIDVYVARSAGDARDQLDKGLDLLKTADDALFSPMGFDALAVASTVEQGLKFCRIAREWLDDQNSVDVDDEIVMDPASLKQLAVVFDQLSPDGQGKLLRRARLVLANERAAARQ